MEQTAILQLPYIMPLQAQKHVTHNEALRMLDALVQLAVLDRDLNEPPADAVDGDRYIVAEGATGAWSGKGGMLAAMQDGAWAFFAPRQGWRAWVADEDRLVVRRGSAWTSTDSAIKELQQLDLLGLGTEADAFNPFSARLNKALWAARHEADGGDGDLRFTMNKAGPGAVLSLLMQSDWSGRAEIGLVGNDDLALRVSPDGATWLDAMVADRSSGSVFLPGGLRHRETGLASPFYLPCPVADIWRLDPSRAPTPRSFTIASVAGDAITLATSEADKVFGSTMRGNVAIRVWNMTRPQPESAWVDWNLSADSLRVTDADHLAGWAPGDTLRLGDPAPTGDNALQMVAIDVSGYLETHLGAVFPQKGLFLSLYVSSSDGASGLDFSATGATGSAAGGNALSDGGRNQVSLPIPTPTPSPISNSNLVFLRESLSGGATDIAVALARVVGVYA